MNALRTIGYHDILFIQFTLVQFVETLLWLGADFNRSSVSTLVKRVPLEQLVAIEIYLDSEYLYDELRSFSNYVHKEAELLAYYANELGLNHSCCRFLQQDISIKYLISEIEICALLNGNRKNGSYCPAILNDHLKISFSKFRKFWGVTAPTNHS